MAANAPALELWCHVGTQWRTGFCGPTGLDYNALYRVARTMGTRLDKALLKKIQTLESDFLQEMEERRKQEGG